MHSSVECFRQTTNTLPRYPEKKASPNGCFVTGEGYTAPGTDAVPDGWSTQDNFLVVETARMNETELAEYARKKGLYVEQIKTWKDSCMNANGGIDKKVSRLNCELKDSEKERRKFEKELQRKEKFLKKQLLYLYCQEKQMRSGGIQRTND